MKKFFTVCVCALMASLSLYAQDIIVTKDAKKIEAKILEVSKSEIKYKEMDNIEGPTFILETNEISSVIYANGKVVLYDNQPTNAPSSSLEGEDMVEIILLSGVTFKAKITEMKNDYIAYTIDGNPYTLSSSQIDQVTFLQNGQVKKYNHYNAVENSQPATSISQSMINDNSNSNNETIAQSKSKRIYRDNGQYYYNDMYISGSEISRILSRESKGAFQQWKKGNEMITGGAVCLGIGCGLAIGSIFPMTKVSNKNSIADIHTDIHYMEIGLGLLCASIVPLGIGLGITIGGSVKCNKAIDLYNSKYDQAAVQFKWHVAPNGLGLAVAF